MPRTTPSPTSWPRTGAWSRSLLWLALLAPLLVACGDDGDLGEDRALTVDRLSPQTAQRGETVRLIGAGFGDVQPQRASAWVGGICTAITGWSDDAVTVVIPESAGGGELLVVLTVEGRVAATGSGEPVSVNVIGPLGNANRTYCDPLSAPGGR